MLEDKMNQTLVYWPCLGLNRFTNIQFGTPVEMACRWEDYRMMLTDSTGKQFMSTARIYLLAEAPLRGYVFEGPLVDFTDESPGHSPNCFEVRIARKIPAVDAQEVLYMAIC